MAASLLKDLKDIEKELKALSKKVEVLVAAAGKTQKPKAAKKAPARRKAAAKKAPAKKAAARKTAPKKTVKPADKKSASDVVLGHIRRTKKGLDNAALIEKTGYDKIKVRNIVFRLKKLNKIKAISRGVFVKA